MYSISSESSRVSRSNRASGRREVNRDDVASMQQPSARIHQNDISGAAPTKKKSHIIRASTPGVQHVVHGHDKAGQEMDLESQMPWTGDNEQQVNHWRHGKEEKGIKSSMSKPSFKMQRATIVRQPRGPAEVLEESDSLPTNRATASTSFEPHEPPSAQQALNVGAFAVHGQQQERRPEGMLSAAEQHQAPNYVARSSNEDNDGSPPSMVVAAEVAPSELDMEARIESMVDARVEEEVRRIVQLTQSAAPKHVAIDEGTATNGPPGEGQDEKKDSNNNAATAVPWHKNKKILAALALFLLVCIGLAVALAMVLRSSGSSSPSSSEEPIVGSTFSPTSSPPTTVAITTESTVFPTMAPSNPGPLGVTLSATIQPQLKLGDEFGSSVSLSSDGKRLATAAPGYGVFRVYETQGDGTWYQLGSDLTIPGIPAFPNSRVALSNDGNTFAFAADYDGNLLSGYVSKDAFVYTFDETSNDWTLVGSVYEEFGISAISLSDTGDHLVVGSKMHPNPLQQKSGAASVYSIVPQQQRQSQDSITQIGDTVYGEEDGDYFGLYVSMAGNVQRFAVGAFLNADGGFRAGHVRVYELTSGNSWDQLGTDIDGEMSDARLGMSLDLSQDGNIVAVGAATKYNDKGAVRVFQFQTNDWGQMGNEIVGQQEEVTHATGEQLGRSLSLSSNGKRLAAGGPNAHVGSSIIRVFDFNQDSSQWEQVGDANFIEDPNYDYDFISISGDGRVVAAGATHDRSSQQKYGQVRIYNVE